MHPHVTRTSLAAVLVTLALGVAACGGDKGGSTSAASSAASSSGSAPAATSSGVSLKGVCRDTVVAQTDWNPESDHSELYELAASGGEIDSAKKRYTADLVTQGKKTGVKIEIRAGGPATGFQSPTQQMYTDRDILLGYVNTDEAIQNSGKLAMKMLMAPREHWAQVLIFDPATYKFSSIADIGKTNTKVLYFQGNVYMKYLTGAGILKSSQVDSSYDGKPARFVASGGKVVQQGFITAEPWQYEHEVKNWMKPVKTLSIEQSGYPNYGETIGVRKGDEVKYATCLKKLIPMIQQAQVDYAADPERADTLIAQLAQSYNTGWVYPKALADYAAKSQLDNKIISNGDTTPDTLGDLDEAKVQKMIDIVGPIYRKQNIKVPTDLAPADIFTNEFIDKSIGLPAGSGA